MANSTKTPETFRKIPETLSDNPWAFQFTGDKKQLTAALGKEKIPSEVSNLIDQETTCDFKIAIVHAHGSINAPETSEENGPTQVLKEIMVHIRLT
jgi:ribosomal protein L7Ae-like RNA K-turn-binding protein